MNRAFEKGQQFRKTIGCNECAIVPRWLDPFKLSPEDGKNAKHTGIGIEHYWLWHW
jgi:hypothetical protein